jgi:glycosyl transferase family 25
MLLDYIPVIYINLINRTDRKDHVEKELKKIGVNDALRFNAVKLDNGALGCSMSHLKCIELAKKNNYDYVFVCEDDIEFLNPELFLTQLKKFLDLHKKWDMALVAGNNMLPYLPVDDTCIKIFNCQTTTGYIVKKHYYDKLINNYKNGIEKLMRNPDSNEYKIDKFWGSIQRMDDWYLIIPLTIVQREDYSDIERKVTNFKNYMLNYNKAYKIKEK